MTAKTVYDRALTLLGSEVGQSNPAEIDSENFAATETVNQILSDLRTEQLSSVFDTLNLSPEKTDALCYGIAMMVSLMSGDVDKNRLFAELYNAKRSTALSEIGNITDKLPNTTLG